MKGPHKKKKKKKKNLCENLQIDNVYFTVDKRQCQTCLLVLFFGSLREVFEYKSLPNSFTKVKAIQFNY